MASVAKAIRDSTDSETYDLKNLTQEQATELVDAALKEPLRLENMIKITLTVGAGKLNRAKYDDELGKWVCSALKNVGYNEDHGASLSLDCAGSFKFQHDTGKNMKYVHVFPKVAEPEESGEHEDHGHGDDGGDALMGGGGPATPEWLCTVSAMATFEQMVAAKMPAWAEKRRCAALLKDQADALQSAVDKLARREELDEDEQRLMDGAEQELLAQKQAFLADQMRDMVDKGRLTAAERAQLLEQVDARIAALEEKRAGAETGAAMEKLAASKAAAEERRAHIAGAQPIKHALANLKELRAAWRGLMPLDALMEKAGPKGAWSSKLTPAEAEQLAKKDEWEGSLDTLLTKARHWFEDVDEFQLRVAEARRAVVPPPKKKSAGGGAKPAEKKAPSANSWATVGGAKGKPRGAGGAASKPAGSGNAFAALAD